MQLEKSGKNRRSLITLEPERRIIYVQSVFTDFPHPVKSQVGAMVQHRVEEVEAIQAWMQHVAEKRAVVAG